MSVQIKYVDRLAAEKLFNDTLGDIGSYAEFGQPSYREGAIRVLSEQLAAHRASTEPRTIYVQWADNGNIRKWAWSEFDLAEKLKAETLPVSDTAELLEALKRLTQWEGHHVYCGHAKDDSRPCVCGFNDAYNAACDVIAKAGAA